MKISVRVKGDWFTVPVPKPFEQTIKWLGVEALNKYTKLRQSHSSISNDSIEIVDEIRKAKGGSILDPEDFVADVLDDNDFVSIVLESDKKTMVTGNLEVHYIPEKASSEIQVTPKTFEYINLNGNQLSTDDLLNLGRGHYKIKLATESQQKIKACRDMLERILRENKVVYGVNTGFGKFATTLISGENLIDLQYNLIRSHSAGVGNPLSPFRTRMLLALRINILAKGYSGISLETLQQLIDAFNASCLSWVPEKGTVGASGDLAPLAHLALGLIGEGKMWSPESGWSDAKYVLESHNLKPLNLKPKEALALINGTQLITSLGAEAVEQSSYLIQQADIVAGMTLEVLKGTTRAFDPDIQKIRPHPGQAAVAKRIRAILNSSIFPSQIAESHRFCNRVQDAYTLRCCPQVHGVVHDTIDFVRNIITTEMNSATDNPLVFVERSEIISSGNFHGEYPAKALDYLAIAVHELGSMSERRIERLVNPAQSGLPAFLVKNGGLNSGFMIAHCTAAALVSENKVLCHPASVDSLSTSAGQEDHVSMGGFSARKVLQVIENVQRIIAIELLAACQAIEFLRPLRTTRPLEAVYHTVRREVKPWENDRIMNTDINAVTDLLQEKTIWRVVKPFIDEYNERKKFDVRPPSPTATVLGKASSLEKQLHFDQMEKLKNLSKPN
ncbi:histidine ammonia-lyase [Dermatophagoides farinae]|uniref:Histidine ammonia-lyase n=1 Tax=Dermatophagoides farinae TaxID=6954 RepID=A0A9D4SK63_DERFA|nr:histidine ammonia-lyase-like [Dermatophagoides farinae]KAH7644813.1 histidine ammonia-lyase-like protein [Dermatophagoides farinae]